MTRSRTKKEAKNASGLRWKPALIALGISIGIGLILLLLASLIASLTPDPGRWIRPLAIAFSAVMYLLAGMVAAKFRPDAPLSAGSANGLLLSALSLALSLLFRKSATALPAWENALLHAGMILLALAGAYLYVFIRKNRSNGRKRKRKHN